MRYLIAEANYGGRVTDALDRRLVNVYINQFFCEDAIDPQINFSLAPQQPDSPYVIPNDADLLSCKEEIKNFPQSDAALAFGQHANADISSQIEDSNSLLGTIVSLQPKVVIEGAETNEHKILRSCRSMQEQVPPLFELKAVRKTMEPRADPEPMKTVLHRLPVRLILRQIVFALDSSAYLLPRLRSTGPLSGSRSIQSTPTNTSSITERP